MRPRVILNGLIPFPEARRGSAGAPSPSFWSALLRGSDYKEGIRAFQQRRTATFTDT